MNPVRRPGSPPNGPTARAASLARPALVAVLGLGFLLALTSLWAGKSLEPGETRVGSQAVEALHDHEVPHPDSGPNFSVPDLATGPEEQSSTAEAAVPDPGISGPEFAGPADSPQRALAEAAGVQPTPGIAEDGTSSGATTRTSTLPERFGSGPDSALGEAPNLGGCLPEYGAAGQCLPVIPPSFASHVQEMVRAGIDPSGMTHPWTCGEVRQFFPEGLSIRLAGTDPQGLDRNSDGIACGTAD